MIRDNLPISSSPLASGLEISSVILILANVSNRLPHVMEIYVLFMALGMLTTLCLKETKRITLEVLSGDEEEEEEEDDDDVAPVSPEITLKHEGENMSL